MEIFTGIKSDLRRLGCILYDHPYKKLLNVIHRCLFLITSFLYFSTPLWFFLFKAETFTDYVESYIPTTTGSIAFSTYCCYLWQRKEILELIMEFESMIGARK